VLLVLENNQEAKNLIKIKNKIKNNKKESLQKHQKDKFIKVKLQKNL